MTADVGARHTESGRRVLSWIGLAVAVGGVAVVLWAVNTAWGAIVHGQPAYAIVLAVTAVASVLGAILALRARRRRHRVLRIVAVLLAVLWIAAVAWLRPHSAAPVAVAAMHSDAGVQVTESVDRVTFTPRHDADSLGVFFQPGALVDARAYAAVLRPLAEHGHTVVIAKQPLGIAFLAMGAFDAARHDHPEIADWIIGGHSLGGTVAAITAQDAQHDDPGAAAGLLLFAAYPATDISATLAVPVESLSGSRDGLATPAKIAASHATLPPSTRFIVIEGASHAQFGAYGPQAGDGVPTIDAADAREQSSAAALAFAAAVARTDGPGR
ncbi:alpha/beta hydrolase [Microbacterium kribbense]|uniref:alpha/beta hydrolase n=1 Tax=Microbacterium kribbense TaxID=433645 RepID=UPI0031E244E4